MSLQRHHVIAIILAIVLLLIVFAAGPAQGQDINVPGGDVTCVENWSCSPWQECIDGFQVRSCTDTKQCGTYHDDPAIRRSCDSASCKEDWNCTEWSACLNGSQMRYCKDLRDCGTSLSKPNTTRQCNSTSPSDCAAEWRCAEWSDCVHGFSIRECTDMNQCGTLEGRPDQTRPCDSATPPQNNSCTEDWVCSKWTACDGQLRSRTCTDVNKCGNAPERTEQEACQVQCLESWECGPWSACLDSSQSRHCSDASICASRPPVEEKRNCDMPQQPPVNGTPSNGTLPPGAEPWTGANRIYDDISPGETARLFTESPESTVSQISVSARKRIVNASIIFRELDSPPQEIPPEPPDRGVFRYLNISKYNIEDDDIDSATVEFQVTKDWLRERLINVSTVRLRRYSGSGWQDLPTILLYDDSERFYYRADTPGFSIFAIAGEYMLEKSGGGMMCLPLDIRCYGSEVQECDISGLSWTITEECEYGCVSPGECRSEPAEQSPVAGEDYVIMLMLALLAIIAVLGFAVMFFRMKRKRISQELSRPVVTPGFGK